MSLDGKVAIVTGGGTGIGFGIAQVLAARGVRLMLAQRRREPLERAASKLAGRDVRLLTLDIRTPKAAERLVGETVAEFGALDILVNNASLTGMPAVASIEACDQQHVDDVVDVNLKGTFYCSQAAAKHMIAACRGGSIVHVSSVGAFAAQEFAALYCATKAAQLSLARSMALELAPHRIRVNAIAPGDILTEASEHVTGDLKAAGVSGRYLRTTPLGRRGTPAEIGRAVAYLVSDEASFVTGATLVVDGGFLTY
jgi:NAD(P)-dependent dehydrogenase (short-subunit alcohol dehydrogenase family)